MPTTVGNYGSTAGIGAGNLRTPILANYGDALAPLANRFNKLEDVVNKQIAIKKEREYQDARDEASRLFQRDMQDDSQKFQEDLEGTRFNNNSKLEETRHNYGLEDLKKKHGYTLEEIAAKSKQEKTLARYRAGLKISTARQIAKLNKQAEKESGINLDFNSMIHTVGISPDEAKRRINDLKKEYSVNKGTINSNVAKSILDPKKLEGLTDFEKDYVVKAVEGGQGKGFTDMTKQIYKLPKKEREKVLNLTSILKSEKDKIVKDTIKSINVDFKTKVADITEQAKGFHVDPLKTSQNVLETKKQVIEKASKGELSPKTANNIVRILDSMERQYVNEANKEYKTKAEYAGEALVKEKEIKKNNLKQYKDLVIEYSKTMPVEQAKEKAKKIMNDKTYLGN